MTVLVVTQNTCKASVLVEGQQNFRVLGGFFLKPISLVSVRKLENT